MPKAVSIFLWGDSHAAHFYTGIKQYLNSKKIIFYQQTLGGCPPVINLATNGPPDCQAFNSDVLEKITTLKPKEVVLSANWAMYMTTPLFLNQLTKTIKTLNHVGVQNVFLIGQSPTLESEPSTFLSENYIDKNKHIPQYTWDSVVKGFDRIDSALLEATKNTSLNYINIYQTLCSEKGCRMYFGDDAMTDLVFLDTHHFTKSASRSIVNSTVGPLLLTKLN